jgi:hypothetical protein
LAKTGAPAGFRQPRLFNFEGKQEGFKGAAESGPEKEFSGRPFFPSF